jgi:hypothetical protein
MALLVLAAAVVAVVGVFVAIGWVIVRYGPADAPGGGYREMSQQEIDSFEAWSERSEDERA